MYRKQGLAHEVTALFEQINKDKVFPNEWTYSILINNYAKHGRIEGARSLLEEMRKSENNKPAGIHYGTLLSACEEKGALDVADALITQAIGDKIFESALSASSKKYNGPAHYEYDLELNLN